ncbi:MAG TPA: hypothetical protein V6D33_13525 [Cyanophyceae cyanobacterium]
MALTQLEQTKMRSHNSNRPNAIALSFSIAAPYTSSSKLKQ